MNNSVVEHVCEGEDIRFEKAKEMLVTASNETLLPMPLKLIDQQFLISCTNLELHDDKLYFKKNGVEFCIEFCSEPLCCENFSIHIDGKPYYYQCSNDFTECFNFLKDEQFCIRVLHFTLKTNIDEHVGYDDGGKVVIDFASGEEFDKNRILHRLVVQNYHNGYYSHIVRIFDNTNSKTNIHFAFVL